MVIIATFMLLFGGGSASFDAVADQVKIHIADAQRSAQILALLEDAEETLKVYGEHVEDTGNALKALNADFETKESRYQAIVEEGFQRYNAAADKILDIRFKMKSLMTSDEWVAVFAPL
jgi:hypothetical protein